VCTKERTFSFGASRSNVAHFLIYVEDLEVDSTEIRNLSTYV
jgi:hypothetical protein